MDDITKIRKNVEHMDSLLYLESEKIKKEIESINKRLMENDKKLGEIIKLMEKEVLFNLYCKNCEYGKELETFDICDECLSNPVNVDSRKPIKFKPGPSYKKTNERNDKNEKEN